MGATGLLACTLQDLTYHRTMSAPQPAKSTTDTIAVHLDIHGEVQGVGYRHAMQTIACKMQLRGWVRNRRDGRVEALVQGPFDQVARLLVWCQNGPRLARVDQVEQQTRAPEPRWTEFVCLDTVD